MTDAGGRTLDDARAVELLHGLVAIPSVSTQERAAVEYATAAMADMGMEARIDEAGNAVGRIGHGPKRILLLGHIDTVPGAIPVRQEGSRLYGRGAVDAKGPLTAFMVAAARAGDLAGAQVTVVGAVEEEAATSKGAYHIVRNQQPADFVAIGEPSAWNRITLGYKGRLLIEYSLKRPMSHTAGRERGACEAAVDFWLALSGWATAYNERVSGLFATVDPSLRSIRSSGDGLYEQVEMSIGLRLPEGLDVADLRARLDEWRGEARVETHAHERPVRATKRGPLPGAFLAAIRAEGGQPAFVNKTGTSDMNVIAAHWDCPIVAYGPGDSSLDHTPDEHIDLDEYLRAIRVLTRVLQRLGTQITQI
ncbi:MAG TPA: [LysW]-lysine hydrolase [Chloroflexi bacterium]|jgi:LysW-gamma-L-lysine carboxypeptidase|nr:[LysW]-lysine hydrolase [Chloroflexota bacterium]